MNESHGVQPVDADEALFFERMRTDPSDGPRLIYADWLDEQGRSAQATFVRLQCALAQPDLADELRSELEAQETALRNEHENTWAAPLAGKVVAWEFRRGVIDCISIDARRFIKHAPELFAAAPLRGVRILEADEHVKPFVRSTALRQVRELDLCGSGIGDDGLIHLTTAPHLIQLDALNLAFTELTDRGVTALARSPICDRLRRLALNDNPDLTARAMAALAQSDHLDALETLDISGIGLDAVGFAALTRGNALPRLRELLLHGNRMGDAGLRSLIDTELFRRLLATTPTLDLRHNAISMDGLLALVESPHFAHVEVLLLDHNTVGDDGLRVLANTWHNTALRVLSLRDNRITDEGCYALARSPLMATLRYLDLTNNFITQESHDRLNEASVSFDWRGPLELKVDGGLRTRPSQHATADAFMRRLRR